MTARYHSLEASAEAGAPRLSVRFRLENRSRETWRSASGPSLGWQIYDPATATFILEGDWTPLARDLAPGDSADVVILVTLPAENGPYRIYISLIDTVHGWLYAAGESFALLDAKVENGAAHLTRVRLTTLARVRWGNFFDDVPKAFTEPVRTVWTNRRLIRSMVRRDILSRYRGSVFDALWAFLNPLLLMAAYFFVFGVVLKSTFGKDHSRTGYVLYFLAGMLPWLAVSEAVGRAPTIVLEYRNYVKKLVFPLATLPVNPVISGLVTESFAILIFIVGLLAVRGGLPLSVAWLPAILIPQLLFTVGLCWFLAALGVFLRDLGQIMGFVLTLWFFLTPICYSDAGLPKAALPILRKNPLFVLVQAYRDVLLEGHAPQFNPMWKLWLLAVVFCLLGHALFHKLRKSFADVI
ncbi:MAG: ABC transporter permease [Bryobacteraceae bacterium]